MKTSRTLCLLLLLFIASCKKDKQSKPQEPIPGWQVYNTANSQIPDDQVNAIAIDGQDVKWLGTTKGVVRLKGTEWGSFNTTNSALPSDYITSVATDRNGSIWAGTLAGLAHYGQGRWQVYTTANSALPDNEISTLFFDKTRQTLWAGTFKGLVKIKSNQPWEIRTEVESEHILSMTADKDGALWIGSFNPIAFAGNIRKFYNGNWSTYHLDRIGYPSAFPYGLAVGSDNTVLSALAGTSVKAVIGLSGNNWQELSLPENEGAFKAIAIENNKVWLAGSGLALLGDKQGPVLSIPGTDSHITCMAIGIDGRKWLGTMYGGLAAYHE